MLKYHYPSTTCVIRITFEKIFAFVKLPRSTKVNTLLFAVLALFAIFAVNGSIASNNIVMHQQASASTNDLASSLSNIIKEKVSDALNKSFNQTQSGIDQQSSSSTTNQQTTKQSSISGANKSTQLNCTNGKCVSTTCTDNNCTTTIQNPSGGITASSAASNITSITIGEPFYKQNDKPTNQKAVKVNGVNATEISFSGTGTANSVNFKDTGKATIIPRSGDASYIQGNAEIVNINNSSEKASYTFQEIGQPASDGTIKANGAAFFGSNAKGKLAFLNNMVVIYQNQIDKAGNSSLVAWKWK
jgi:hypothetical protein